MRDVLALIASSTAPENAYTIALAALNVVQTIALAYLAAKARTS